MSILVAIIELLKKSFAWWNNINQLHSSKFEKSPWNYRKSFNQSWQPWAWYSTDPTKVLPVDIFFPRPLRYDVSGAGYTYPPFYCISEAKLILKRWGYKTGKSGDQESPVCFCQSHIIILQVYEFACLIYCASTGTALAPPADADSGMGWWVAYSILLSFLIGGCTDDCQYLLVERKRISLPKSRLCCDPIQ